MNPSSDFSHLAMTSLEEMCFEAQREQLFTAWAWSTPHMACSVYFADEAGPHLKGLEPQSTGFHPRFDLASLTKPILGAKLLHLWKLWDDPIPPKLAILPSHLQALVNALDKPGVTWGSLANHTIPVAPWLWMGSGRVFSKKGSSSWETLISERLTQAYSLANHQGLPTSSVYSDLNYMALALLLPLVAKDDLSPSPSLKWQDILGQINKDYGAHFQHCALEYQAHHAVPFFPYIAIQGDFTGQGTPWGACHDLNQNMFSGQVQSLDKEWHWPKPQDAWLSLHGGLFGNILDVIKAVKSLKQDHFNAYSQSSLNQKSKNRFVYGLDTPTGPKSTCGLDEKDDDFCNTFGHLAYTGPMFWFTKNYEFAFLCNRTAKRQTLGSENIPLLKVITNLQTEEHTFYIKTQLKKPWDNLSLEDYLCVSSESRGLSKIRRDESYIQLPPNLNPLRTNISKALFSFQKQ